MREGGGRSQGRMGDRKKRGRVHTREDEEEEAYDKCVL